MKLVKSRTGSLNVSNQCKLDFDIDYICYFQLCSAVNNIEYVGLEMKPISEKLGTEHILSELARMKGERIGSQCRRTLETVIENADENINNKVYEILEKVGAKVNRIVDYLREIFKRELDRWPESVIAFFFRWSQ
jgi:hypothetical protein